MKCSGIGRDCWGSACAPALGGAGDFTAHAPAAAGHGEGLVASCSFGAEGRLPPWVSNDFRMWATLAMRLLGRAAMPWEA